MSDRQKRKADKARRRARQVQAHIDPHLEPTPQEKEFTEAQRKQRAEMLAFASSMAAGRARYP